MMVVPRSRLRSLLALVVLAIGLVGLRLQHDSDIWTRQAKAKWAEVQNQYQRRADLIPNLVSTVQGYAKQEKDVLTAVIEARSKATSVNIDASQITDPEKVKQFQAAQAQLSGALGRLIAVSENYPELEVEPELPGASSRSSKGTENRIAVARRDYIEAARTYNTELRTFPGSLWAATAFRDAKPMAVVHGDGGKCRQATAGQVLTLWTAWRTDESRKRLAHDKAFWH